ncbi:MAG TPA: hypothetical protein VG322_07990 [Candidatus Acidoferrales bacterium]|jgi:hypothetical protein|nr:hypothetical protein [Candidatus Acidoferrales bacterium]
MNKVTVRRYAWSYAIGAILTIFLGVVASVTDSAIGALLLPGMLLAAIPFREGIHSGHSTAWFAVTGFMEAFVLSWPVMLVWTLVVRSRQAQRNLPEGGKSV